MQLPIATKALLAKEFGFSKTGPTHVSDSRVVSDGYKVADVENAMDISAIKKYVGAKDAVSYDDLWNMMIDKVEGRTVSAPPEPEKTSEPITVPVEEPEEIVGEQKTVIVQPSAKKQRGRPKRMM